MNDDDEVSLEASLAGGMAANPFAFPNPGAVFGDIDEAARHALTIVNPVSKSMNREHAWQLYYDPHSGKYGYTDPFENGLRGGEIRFPNLSQGMTAMGMGHTHGDYTDQYGTRGRRDTDANDSDNFSGCQALGGKNAVRPGGKSDMRSMQTLAAKQAMEAGHPIWVYYLGTPSGRFLKWQYGKPVENFE